MKTTPAFEEAYAQLNAMQKQAVDTVEGPVLVIAGPGTGKTHLLTVRIAHLLRATDTNPENILALTFTDSAARTISKRLAGLVGDEAARKVGVYTFHSFAEHIIKKYPLAFGEHTDRRLMGELEQVLVWRDVLSARESILRSAKTPYHYLGDLLALEDELTREQLSLEGYLAWLDEEAKRIEEDPSLRYVRGGKGGAAGDLNPTGVQRLLRLEKGKEAAALIEAYRNEKEIRGLYGYTDVLRIVVDALSHDEALCAELQEQYQYVLADEHQDANALQHALLDALAYDDHPNLCIVGDEKQAVFGFQGADATHFKTFLAHYPRTTVITLTQNYRSKQGILDVAHELLKEIPSSTGAHVPLEAHRGEGGSISLFAAEDPLSEREGIASLIKKAIAEGVAPHEIAIITLKNKTADLFSLHLKAQGVPVLRAGNVDLDGRPSIRYLLALMHAVGNPLDVSALREALLAPWWEESLSERASFVRRASYQSLHAELETAFPRIANFFTMLQKEAVSMPPMNVFSHLLHASGARAYFISEGEHVQEDVPLVRALVMHIEDLVRRTPNATFGEIMESFRRATEHEIGSIKTSLTQQEGKVTVITAHKAKGMEFERVFVTSLTAREWEGRGRVALIPSPFDAAREHEEVVRLLYVAMTRAKNELVLSYGRVGAEGKEQAPISILPSGLPAKVVEVSPIPLMHEEVEAPSLVRELTLLYLMHDGLSPSALNEYLESPPTFFAKRVLRLFEPETQPIVIGNALHAGVAAYLTHKDKPEAKTLAHAEVTRSLMRSLLPRGSIFDQLSEDAHTLLDTYVQSAFVSREPLAIEQSVSVHRTVGLQSVLLKGKVDAVFKGETGACIVDFKTSSAIDTKDKEKFERQIAFYDLLLRSNGHETTQGSIVQITKDGVKEYDVLLTDDTRKKLLDTLDEVLVEMLAGTWRTGAPSPYDHMLALFSTPRPL